MPTVNNPYDSLFPSGVTITLATFLLKDISTLVLYYSNHFVQGGTRLGQGSGSDSKVNSKVIYKFIGFKMNLLALFTPIFCALSRLGTRKSSLDY